MRQSRKRLHEKNIKKKGIPMPTCMYWQHWRMTVNSQHCTQLNMNTCVSLNKFRVICACGCVFKEEKEQKNVEAE